MGVVLAKELWKEDNVPFLDLGLERPCVFLLALLHFIIPKRKSYPG